MTDAETVLNTRVEQITFIQKKYKKYINQKQVRLRYSHVRKTFITSCPREKQLSNQQTNVGTHMNFTLNFHFPLIIFSFSFSFLLSSLL